MKEDLEARERGVKRGREEEEEGPEERLEREVRRLAEDGKRRRREREEMLRRELRVEEEAAEEERNAPREADRGDTEAQDHVTSSTTTPQAGVPEIDRTVKVRWPREGAGEHLDKDRLTLIFSIFGPIESAFLLKDKKAKTADKREKKMMATGVIVYTSVIGAYAAVEDTKKQVGGEWLIFDSVFWAGNKEPNFLPQTDPLQGDYGSSTPPSTPFSSHKPSNIASSHSSVFTPTPAGNGTSTPLAPSSTTNANGNGLRKVPSFASFSSASLNTPSKTSPFGKGLGPNNPSLEEITMIRLRNAEKRRLEEEIRRGDEEAAAAAVKEAAARDGG